MNKQIFAGIIIVVVIAAGVIGYMIGTSSIGGVLGGDASLRAKLEEVKKMFPTMPDSNFISGQVKSVSGNVIILNTPTSNPFDESPVIREITVTSATKIVKNENKSPETIQKEQEAYQKKMASFKPGSTDTLATPPMPFIEKEISVSDIKEGDQINVEAETQIRMVEKFEAVKITVQFSPIAPASPASAPVTVPPASSKP